MGKSNDDNNLAQTEFATSIDSQSILDAAQKYDFTGRDLVITLDIDFGTIKPVNFVTLDPVLFDSSVFIQVLDVATSIEDETGFTTVDGFDEQIFDKIITPEANKQLQVQGVTKILGPASFNYQGLGVFAFPLREAKKIRILLKMDKPVPAIYEKMHILMQEVSTITTKTKTKKKSLFCWVAREIYGEQDIRWLLFREWLVNDSPKWFYCLYKYLGEYFAKFISNKPRLKKMIKKWMNAKLKS